ncbi:hypothetical protein ACIQKB_37655 [Streptomyces sp. NPDC092046]|uniref:hypothetical protein n=1 Tax=Streptomyces sp. NPDC092046 TaxID=3366009 RepID=UPI0037F60263
MTTADAAKHPLFIRYQGSVKQWKDHVGRCSCRAEEPCSQGQPLFDRLATLQDAWLNHLSRQRR